MLVGCALTLNSLCHMTPHTYQHFPDIPANHKSSHHSNDLLRGKEYNLTQQQRSECQVFYSRNIYLFLTNLLHFFDEKQWQSSLWLRSSKPRLFSWGIRETARPRSQLLVLAEPSKNEILKTLRLSPDHLLTLKF